MSDILFHHYPQSPVSEKVRVGFGIKGMPWRSVEIPRIPPKPDLMPLTGGYRRTPVMQIGADVYCDSICILRELERRYPEPSFFPLGMTPIDWGYACWIDQVLFTTTVGVVLGSAVDDLPPEFAADRGRLYFGPSFDLQAEGNDLAYKLSQLRTQLGWANQQLADNRNFLQGARPALIDALVYYIVWFLRGRFAGGPEFLDQFSDLLTWEDRIRAVGHGRATDMDAKEALSIAKAASPDTPAGVDALDSIRLERDSSVAVAPDGDGGDPAVAGRLVGLTPDVITIAREDAEVGQVHVHFPRVGYRVERA